MRISRPRHELNPAPKHGAKPERKVRKAKLTRERLARLSDDAAYNAVGDVFKTANPHCFYCGQPFEPGQLQNDHMAGGPNRGESLLNFDTICNTCQTCHDKGIPVHEKLAAKLVHVVRAVIGYRGKAFNESEDNHILKRLRKALKQL